MPLDTTGFKTGLKAKLDELYTNTGNLSSDQARTKFSNDLGDLLETWVKSGDGVYQTGRLTAGANVVTAVGSPAIKIQ